MKRALGAYETRGLGGRSSSQVHQANASAAPLSALETHVSLVGHKDLPAEAYRQLRRPQGRPRGHRERSPGSLTITSRNGILRPHPVAWLAELATVLAAGYLDR